MAPAPGAAGVPADAISASSAMMMSCGSDTEYPAQPAMNSVAVTCMIAVPFMLIVMPSGSTNEAMVSSTPKSSVQVFRLSGSAAALEEVEKPNTATLLIFLRKVIGFLRVATATMIG